MMEKIKKIVFECKNERNNIFVVFENGLESSIRVEDLETFSSWPMSRRLTVAYYQCFFFAEKTQIFLKHLKKEKF